jgi:lysyl-tRNA synthetase class 2
VSLDAEQQRLARIKPNLQRRALITQSIRSFFISRGFLEVDTPIRTPSVAPEKYVSPFDSEGWYLSTSPELYMKRLLAAGYDKLFQVTHCFRKGESGKQHNPEFSMLEWYRRGCGYREMISDTEALVNVIATDMGFGTVIPYPGGNIDITCPWARTSVRDAFIKTAGWDPIATPDSARFDLELVTKVIPEFDTKYPVIVEGYPAIMASLAKLSPTDPLIAERAEVFIAGLELANAYSELNNAQEQKIRFEEEANYIRGTGSRVTMPVDFLNAVSHLPECGGIALGMDRLVMLFCGVDSIEEVVAFPVDLV